MRVDDDESQLMLLGAGAITPLRKGVSGGRFDPGGCDPATQAPRFERPRLPRVRGGLWLGRQHEGLLLTDVYRWDLMYDDCARFEGCPATITLWTKTTCQVVPRHPRRRFRMRGAVVLYDGPLSPAYVLSGRTVTGIRIEDATRLADVRRIVRHLRPFRASSARGRLAPPRAC